MHGNNLVVKNGDGKKVIVKAQNFRGKGQVIVTEKDVRYQAEARFGN